MADRVSRGRDDSRAMSADGAASDGPSLFGFRAVSGCFCFVSWPIGFRGNDSRAMSRR